MQKKWKDLVGKLEGLKDLQGHRLARMRDAWLLRIEMGVLIYSIRKELSL